MQTLSFKEILSKMTENSMETPEDFQSGLLFDSYFEGPAPSVENIEYHRQFSPMGFKNAIYFKAKKEVLSQGYTLTQEQERAFSLYNAYLPEGLVLPAGFSKISLKQTFRKAVKKLHPDHGGSSSVFNDFFLSYKILLDFLQSMK